MPLRRIRFGWARSSVFRWVIALIGSIALAPAAKSADPPETINLRRTVIVDVAERTKDAVVYVSSTKMVTQRLVPFGDPFFQQFNLGPTRQVPMGSLGSGFIIHPDGFIVTNNHVIDRAQTIIVELLDGQKYSAELVSSDPEADLAILHIRPKRPLTVLQLGDSSDLMIGEPVIAVGNPLGFSHTVSSGIVSALHRKLTAGDEDITLDDLVQTDAAINPGNSGGPLLNAYGQVIGINTAIRGDAQNIGFAIPIDRLRDLIPELMDPAQVNKVALPVKFTEKRSDTPPATVTAALLRNGIGGENGKLELATINGIHPANIVDVYAALLRLGAGQKLALTYKDGRAESFVAQAVPQPGAVDLAHQRFGLTLEQVTPALSDKLNLAREDGLLVTAVDSNSPASRALIKPGDILFQLGLYRVATVEDLARIMNVLPESGQVKVVITRGDRNGRGVIEY
jgi:serine protease Do